MTEHMWRERRGGILQAEEDGWEDGRKEEAPGGLGKTKDFGKSRIESSFASKLILKYNLNRSSKENYCA